MNQQVYWLDLQQSLSRWERATFQNQFVLLQENAPPHKSQAVRISWRTMIRKLWISDPKFGYQLHRTLLEPDGSSYPWHIQLWQHNCEWLKTQKCQSLSKEYSNELADSRYQNIEIPIMGAPHFHVWQILMKLETSCNEVFQWPLWCSLGVINAIKQW